MVYRYDGKIDMDYPAAQVVEIGTPEELDESEAADHLQFELDEIEDRKGSVVCATDALHNADMCLGTSLSAYIDDFSSPIYPKIDPELADCLEPGELVITHGDDPNARRRTYSRRDTLTAVGAMTPQGLVMLYEKPAASKRESRLVYADYPEHMQQTLETAVGPISPNQPVTDKQVVKILGVYTDDVGPMGDDNLGQLLAEEHLEKVGPYSVTYEAENDDGDVVGHVTRTYLV